MKKIVNRLIQSVLTMFIVSILCFALTKIAPGDPVLAYERIERLFYITSFYFQTT